MLFHFLFIILFFLVSWLRPKLALFLLLFLLPTYQLRFQVLGLPTTFLEVMILTLFFVLLIKKQLNFSKINKTWRILVLAWLLSGLVSVFVAPDFMGALGHWRAYFFEPILFLLIFVSLIKDKKDIQRVFHMLSFLVLIISGWVIWQKIIGQGMASIEIWRYPLVSTIRPTGPFPQSNFLGLFLGPLVLLFVGQFVSFFKNKKLLLSIYYFLVSIFSMLAIILAKSEGAILGVLAGLIFFFIFYLKKRSRWIFVVVLLLIAIFLLFASPWQKTIWQKITFQDLSLQIRLNIWQGAWQMIATHPFFGVGLRGYQQLVNQYQQPFVLPGVAGIVSDELHPYPHNLFLALWAELGILGLLVFLLIVIRFFYEGFHKIIFTPLDKNYLTGQALRTNSNVPNPTYYLLLTICSLMAAMVVILTHGLIDTPYFKNDLSILFWLIIGLLMIMEKNHRQGGASNEQKVI